MSAPQPPVFLLDVDNTLFDNDRFAADLGLRLGQSFGAEVRDLYWTIFARLRQELGYADYLTPVQRLRDRLDDEPELLRMSAWLLDYPFAERLYPLALELVAELRNLGQPVILSDGDLVFQPRKIQRSGLWDAVHGEVLIYIHKQDRLAAVQRRHPAAHYVMVDDKLPILAAMKEVLGTRLTTVFARQGHYALHPDNSDTQFRPDITVGRIGELLGFDWPAPARPESATQETT
jgi:FMN phosphatase YigB (HAD superfamily)